MEISVKADQQTIGLSPYASTLMTWTATYMYIPMEIIEYCTWFVNVKCSHYKTHMDQQMEDRKLTRQFI